MSPTSPRIVASMFTDVKSWQFCLLEVLKKGYVVSNNPFLSVFSGPQFHVQAVNLYT